MPDPDPQAPSLPYTLPVAGGITLSVDDAPMGDSVLIEVDLAGASSLAAVVPADRAVETARALLAAAGSTARVVCGQPTDTPVPWPCYRNPDHAGGHQAVAPDRAALVVADSPKMIRETLAVAATALGRWPDRRDEHVARLDRLAAECDRHRPLGPDGKHGDRHTPTCGCEDKPSRIEESPNISSETPTRLRCARDPQCTGCQSCWEEAMASAPGGDQGFSATTEDLPAEGGVDLEAIRHRDRRWAWVADPDAPEIPIEAAEDRRALLAEVGRLRGERDRAWEERDQAHDDAARLRRKWAETEWLEGARQRLTRERDEAALVARYRRLERDRYRTAWVSARGRAQQLRRERDEIHRQAAIHRQSADERAVHLQQAQRERDQARADLRMAAERDEQIVQDAREAGAQAATCRCDGLPGPGDEVPERAELSDRLDALEDGHKTAAQVVSDFVGRIQVLERRIAELEERAGIPAERLARAARHAQAQAGGHDTEEGDR